ncbi:hypothetical protein HME9302_00983 [Alteripontixanthobacter maritimus]|uniref:Uncharacterized protein n=1 Tax=Alteripontixanthobacter maritimus TaxID=2161824 RepID=A0A369QC04_9SPHN|nr:hypothetical protein [Alteripontixanthobacter maritimus]RDC59788.1 hypothetical protein HME9302_00983 [Alteripontixanthobacter maritimus]
MTGSHIGKTIYVSGAAPATNDAAGFAGLAWTKVEGVQTLPQLGVSHSNIDVSDLETGFAKGIKGEGSGNDSTASFRNVEGDAGQELVRTLANAGGDEGVASIRIVKGSGPDQAPATGDPVEYAHGYLHSFIRNQGDSTTYEGFSVNFKQNALPVDATEA